MISTITIYILRDEESGTVGKWLVQVHKSNQCWDGIQSQAVCGLKDKVKLDLGPIFLEATTGCSGAQTSYILLSLDMQDVCQITYHKC